DSHHASSAPHFLSSFFQAAGPHRELHSFPTRRSSDLIAERGAGAEKAGPNRVQLKPQEISNFRVAQLLEFAQHDDFAVERLKFLDRKSTRLNSSHRTISYAVFCLKKKITTQTNTYT